MSTLEAKIKKALGGKKALTKDDILSADDLQVEIVLTPEWKKKGAEIVIVRSLTGTERDQYEALSVTKRGDSYEANFRNIRARLVALTIVNPEGERIFNEKEIEALGSKNAAALNRVFEVAQRLSGLGKKDIEELAGNSDGGQDDSSSSD